MAIPVQVTFRNMEPSEAIERNIRRRAQRLERFSGRLVSCRVVIEAPHRHHRKGRLYSVSVDLSLPGQDVTVSREGPRSHAHEDVNVAIRDAFNAAIRRLEDSVRRMRRAVKSHHAPLHGRVSCLFPGKGYGFITAAPIGELYFHENSVVGDAFKDLQVGSEVRVTVAERESERGYQASTVHRIGKHHLTD